MAYIATTISEISDVLGIQDAAYGLQRISLPGRWMNRADEAHQRGQIVLPSLPLARGASSLLCGAPHVLDGDVASGSRAPNLGEIHSQFLGQALGGGRGFDLALCFLRYSLGGLPGLAGNLSHGTLRSFADPSGHLAHL